MDKTVLITGGTGGIGAALCTLFASRGYDVAFCFQRDRARADELVQACVAHGVKCLAHRCDIADPKQVAGLFDGVQAQLGEIGVLVNNAGIIGGASKLVDLDPQQLSNVFDINLFGAVYCSQQAARRMGRSFGGSGGTIINISSIAALLGSPNEYVHYAASKGALDSLTVGLAKELGPDGIRVNAVRAGTVDTPIHQTQGNPNRPAMVAQNSPLGRMATPDDIAEAVWWLAQPEASYVNGAILPVHGGG
ncbi:3-oxoacyl-[acyl-carrier-protein] reductase [Maritalea myrionectae]|uniref:3-oxoacyl-[acyl-carrier-protein] reductase n=1 Tax=Maritalea myrionectae TaxID=454601 RepID=A0A2R4MAF4_9HYPH|nr:SDR family oxidoreductase [Maritalea myrionectae]AVX02935.1 3-oxoacyl-[acyl-carrier-protein] reductase [Maritalea myrionectae]